MSPRRFTGWEPVEVTLYEYDDAGRVVAAVTAREPEFVAADVAALLASRRADKEPRNQYGHLLAETMSPEGDPSKRGAKYRYVAEPVTDFDVQAVERAQDAYKKAYPEGDMSGIRWMSKRVDL